MKSLNVPSTLLLALAAVVLVGCGKQEASSSTAAKTPAPAAAQAAAPATAAKGPAIETVDQKVSYGIGYKMGLGLAQDKGLNVDQAAMNAGMADGLAEAKTRVPEEEIQAAFMEVQTKVAALQAAAAEKQLAAGKEYLAKNKARAGVTETASGLQYEVLTKGTGAKPKETDRVRVHYHGTLIDGTVFDSSVERKEPIEHPVNGFVPGWVEALQLMSVGDKWKLTLPPAIGYGARANGKIPANSVLVFEVELIEIK